jgi:hypothetical protein
MVDASGARVIPLHRNLPRSEADLARQRLQDMSRHPSSVSKLADHSPTDGFPTVVGHIGTGRQSGSDEKYTDLKGLVLGIAAVAAFVRRRVTADYTGDEFCFDAQFNDAIILPLLGLLYDKWFRVETTGVDNLPVSGPALVVINHAGVLPVDALMVSVAARDLTEATGPCGCWPPTWSSRPRCWDPSPVLPVTRWRAWPTSIVCCPAAN